MAKLATLILGLVVGIVLVFLLYRLAFYWAFPKVISRFSSHVKRSQSYDDSLDKLDEKVVRHKFKLKQAAKARRKEYK